MFIEHGWLILINTKFCDTEEIHSDLEIYHIESLNKIHDDWGDN